MQRFRTSSIAALAISALATSSAWAVAEPATGSSYAYGSYQSISGSKLSSNNQTTSDAGGFVDVEGAKWGNGYSASAEATEGALKAFASTTYTAAQYNWNTTASNSNASASFTDFVTFSGGNGVAEGTFLSSLSGMLSGGKTGHANYSLSVTLCDVASDYCGYWGSGQSLVNDNKTVSGRSSVTLNNAYESTFDFEFGKTYQLTSHLDVYASNGGTADFANSAHLSFDMGNGVALASASGYQYGVPAVPEPETFAMMLSGLGMMGFVARRRRK